MTVSGRPSRVPTTWTAARRLEHVRHAVVVLAAKAEVEEHSPGWAEVVRMVQGLDDGDDLIVAQEDVPGRDERVQPAGPGIPGLQHANLDQAGVTGRRLQVRAGSGHDAAGLRGEAALVRAAGKGDEEGGSAMEEEEPHGVTLRRC
jgi:hypothetical protein